MVMESSWVVFSVALSLLRQAWGLMHRSLLDVISNDDSVRCYPCLGNAFVVIADECAWAERTRDALISTFVVGFVGLLF